MFAACKVPLHERRYGTSVGGVTGNIETHSPSAFTLCLSLPPFDIMGLRILPVTDSYVPSRQRRCI